MGSVATGTSVGAAAVAGTAVAGTTAVAVAAGPQPERIMLVTTTSDMSKNIERFTISLLLNYRKIKFGFVSRKQIVSVPGASFPRNKGHYTIIWANSNHLEYGFFSSIHLYSFQFIVWFINSICSRACG
jgi:hypothetical protein